MTPSLILQGDKRKARQWIPFAEIKLKQLKAFLPVVNQVYQPTPCITVHIRSVNDIDRIKVFACLAGGCENGFSLINPINIPPAGTEYGRFSTFHKVDRKAPPSATGMYEFGDNTTRTFGIDPEGSILHLYRAGAGAYDVTLRSFVNKGTIFGGLSSFSPTTAVFTAGTTDITRAVGVLRFDLHFILTIADISVTIDGEPVTITTGEGDPDRGVAIYTDSVSSDIMEAVVTNNGPIPPIGFQWLATHPSFQSFNFFKYKCLAKTTKIIEVPFVE